MARVELADRTWMQMDLWRHVGWGKRAFFDSLADPDTRLRIRFLGFESGMLTGSAKELYAEAIAQSTGALRGTIVESFHGGAFISLAPGVVGICSAANLVPGRPMLLAVGSPVAVRVDAVDERRIELNRNRALASVLTDAAGKTVRGFVDRVEPSYAIVEIAPGIAGLLHVSEFAGKGRSLVGQLRRDEEVAVRVLSVSREGERFNIKLSGNQLSSDVGQIEAGGDLVELLPNPDVDLSEVLAAALAGEGRSRIKSRSRKTHDPGVQRHQ